MSAEAIGPAFSITPAVVRPGVERASPIETSMQGVVGRSGGSTSFGETLGRLLAEPRSEIWVIRSEVAAIRSGTPILAAPRLSALATELRSGGGLTGVPGWLDAQLATQATGYIADPYGWRGATRQIGERVIGPGYGALFERQIQQESGFLPEVVYGLRVSTAGAEGIAQLMPQYYSHVARTDPVAGLQAGAESMRQYLNVWNGDVRKALASYNAGLGRVQSLIASHGSNWEAGLPQETRTYLTAIVGNAEPRFAASGAGSDEGVAEDRGARP